MTLLTKEENSCPCDTILLYPHSPHVVYDSVQLIWCVIWGTVMYRSPSVFIRLKHPYLHTWMLAWYACRRKALYTWFDKTQVPQFCRYMPACTYKSTNFHWVFWGAVVHAHKGRPIDVYELHAYICSMLYIILTTIRFHRQWKTGMVSLYSDVHMMCSPFSPPYTTVHHSIPQYTSVYHNTPQYTSVHHSTPQYTTVYHSAPLHDYSQIL